LIFLIRLRQLHSLRALWGGRDPEHQRTESPSPPTPPTKLWQLVLLRLLCGSPSAACLPGVLGLYSRPFSAGSAIASQKTKTRSKWGFLSWISLWQCFFVTSCYPFKIVRFWSFFGRSKSYRKEVDVVISWNPWKRQSRGMFVRDVPPLNKLVALKPSFISGIRTPQKKEHGLIPLFVVR